MKREYKLFIEDIKESIAQIDEFVGNMDFKDFVRDEKTSSAVVRKLEIIGEAKKMFDIKKAIKESSISKKDLQKLEKEIREEFPNDKMMYELHLIRALKSV